MEIALLFSIFIVAMLAGVSVAPAMIVACIADVLIFGQGINNERAVEGCSNAGNSDGLPHLYFRVGQCL